MTDEVKHLIDVMAMLDRCRETSCCKCEQLEFNGMIACNDEIAVYQHAAKFLEAFSSELEKVKRERDAAVEDLKDRCYTGKAMCNYCIFLKNGQFCAKECDDGECFEWRGPQEDPHD